MSIIAQFESRLLVEQLEIFQGLNNPFAIQEYLDAMPYVAEERNRSPLNVMLDRQSHCLDGGFFAALALWRLGFKPLVIDIVPDPGKDDDHVLALYQIEGYWGALAKSNYVNLGFREPVYKSLRELVMTYFEHYCSVKQEKSLRGYTRPFDISKTALAAWPWDENQSKRLYKRFYQRKAIPLISPVMASRLNPVTDRAYAAEILHTDLNWSFGIRPDH